MGELEELEESYLVPVSLAMDRRVDFYEVIYCLGRQSEPFRLVYADYFGGAPDGAPRLLSRETFQKYVQDALDDGLLRVADAEKACFCLESSAVPTQDVQPVLPKPVAYVENGWYRHLGDSPPLKWLLNFLIYHRCQNLGFPAWKKVLSSLEDTPFSMTLAQLHSGTGELRRAQTERNERELLKQLCASRKPIIEAVDPGDPRHLRWGQEFVFYLRLAPLAEFPSEPVLDEYLTMVNASRYFAWRYWNRFELLQASWGWPEPRHHPLPPLSLRQLASGAYHWITRVLGEPAAATVDFRLLAKTFTEALTELGLVVKEGKAPPDRPPTIRIRKRSLGDPEGEVTVTHETLNVFARGDRPFPIGDALAEIFRRTRLKYYRESSERARQALRRALSCLLRRDEQRVELAIRLGSALGLDEEQTLDIFNLLIWKDRSSPSSVPRMVHV